MPIAQDPAREQPHPSPPEHLLALLDAAPFAIMEVGLEGNVRYWNRAAEELFGWRADEVIGHPPPTGVSEALEDERAGFARAILSGESVRDLVVERTHRDGSTIVVTGAAAPVFDADGEVVSVIAIGADATEQDRLQRQVEHSQRMEAVGRLAGGIAHDFNNLLTAILGSVEFLLEDISDTAHRDDLESIRRAAARGSALTGQLLAVGRSQLLDPAVIDLNEVILGMRPMLRRLLRDDVTLVARTAPEASPVRIDPAQLEQVLLNLTVNARDAMPGGGRLFLNVDNVTVTDGAAASGPAPGEYVRLVVRDTGVGMSPDTLAHAFEPFFTTKPAAEGTGLGLSAIYGVVTQSGGTISASSERDQGTTFVLHLPRAGAGREPTSGPAESPAAPAASPRTVLLVEDDAAVRGVCRQVLERIGHRVIEATDGHAALADAREMDGTLDLLVTDIVLPGMDGIELAGVLALEHSPLTVLLISGFSERMDIDRFPAGTRAEFLSKPFAPAELERRVRALFAPPGA